MKISLNKLVIISGCSGGGKSTLLAELNNNGYTTIPEVGREIVKEQLTIGGDILPWKKPQRFCEILIEKSINAYHQAAKITSTKEQVIFFDRSFLEGVSYYQTLKIAEANKYDYLIDNLRYYFTIFMTPPWQEIFSEDAERKHCFAEAVKEYERLLECYPRYGYRIVEIPKMSVKERYAFIIATLYAE